MLPQEIAYHHDHEVGAECRPRRAHVASGDAYGSHKDDVKPGHDDEAQQRQVHAPARVVGEFVPQAQVEEHAEAQLGGHHHRYDAQPFPVAGCYEVAQQRQEVHHAQEDDQPEQHEAFHGRGIRLTPVFARFFASGKDKGLVGVAEGLRKHYHDYRYLHVGGIDAYHGVGGRALARKEVGHQYLSHVLTQYAGDAQH